MNFLNNLTIFILTIKFLNASGSNLNDKKIKNKLKHAKPNYKLACSDFEHDFNPHVERRLFMPVLKNQLASLQSNLNLYNSFLKQCSNETSFSLDQEMIEITWKYQFYESPHCIRVVLDLGNLTKFKSSFNYDFYMFSYREFGKKNIHLKRNIINESTNSLTIHRVHIKPYVVCVSFYKNDINTVYKNSNNSNEDEQAPISCPDLNDFFLNDQRVHDVDLCVDIDTQAHFLSAINSDEPHSLDSELLMVIFIIGLLGFVLLIITLTYYLIEKPRRVQLIKRLRLMINKKSNAQSINQSTVGSHNSLNKESKVGSKEFGPSIVVTDCSNLDRIDEPKETDNLLSGTQSQQSQSQIAKPDIPTVFVPVLDNGTNKVMFHIGETIMEESPCSSQAKIVDESNTIKEENSEDNQECIKTISHLLDDKPWSSSQAQLDINRRQSRSNSFFNNNNNNNTNHVHFGLSNE